MSMCSTTARSSIPARPRSLPPTRSGSAPWPVPARRNGAYPHNRPMMGRGRGPASKRRNRRGGFAMSIAIGRLTMRSRGLAAACGVVLALAMAAPAAAQTVKIGVILSYSGPAASIGEQLDNAIKLYVKEHEKELPTGVKVEIIRRDDTGPNPDVAKRLAQELITRDKVQFLTGVIWTPNANAIAPLTAEAKVPFVIMNAAGVNTTRLSPYVARTSFTLWQSCYPLGGWAAKQGMKKAYTLVSDYAPGFDGEAAFTKGFTQAGGEIVGSARVPLKDPDFVPFVQRARDAKPDVLFVFAPSGKQATAVMKAYGDLGLAAAGITAVACLPDGAKTKSTSGLASLARCTKGTKSGSFNG